MGEARRKNSQELLQNHQTKKKNKKEFSPKIFDWLPTTYKQEDMFIQLSIRGAWIGIGCLVLLWIIVRVVGPSLGWWVPADLR